MSKHFLFKTKWSFYSTNIFAHCLTSILRCFLLLLLCSSLIFNFYSWLNNWFSTKRWFLSTFLSVPSIMLLTRIYDWQLNWLIYFLKFDEYVHPGETLFYRGGEFTELIEFCLFYKAFLSISYKLWGLVSKVVSFLWKWLAFLGSSSM